MSNVEELEEREDQPHAGWVPKVITGGKGPPEAPSEDWLTPLEQFTTFVCRQNSNTTDGELYHLQFKGTQFYLLLWELPDGKVWSRYVHPASFCKQHKEYEILGVIKPITEGDPKPPTQGDDNERNSHRHPDLVLHEAVQGVDQVVQGTEEPDL